MIGTIYSKLIDSWSNFKKYLSDFWHVDRNIVTVTWKAVFFKIAIVLLVFIVLDKVLLELTTQPFEIYYEKFIFFEFLKNIPVYIYLILFVAIILAYFKKKLFLPWQDFEQKKSLRIVVMAPVFLLTWAYTTYDFNFYFNQGHYLDRFLLLVFALLIYIRPIFIAPFLILLYLIIGQFEVYPGYSLAVQFLLTKIIILYFAFYILKTVHGKFRFADFVFLVGCLIAANYFASGYGKLNVDWLLNDKIYYLIPNSYANGWLPFMSVEAISNAIAYAAVFNVPLKIFTILMECGMIFLFFNFKLTRLLFGFLLIFHLGILAYTGIFFWMWMLLLMTLLLFVFKAKVFKESIIFNKKYLLLSFMLISLGKYWCKPVPLAWHDVPLKYTYKFSAQIEDGTVYDLPPQFFAPYDYQFTLGNFKFLSPNKILPITAGVAGLNTSRFFNKELNENEIFILEKNEGQVHLDTKKQESFNYFLKQYVRNWNNKAGETYFLHMLQPPRLLLTFPTNTIPSDENKITRIDITEVTSFYSKKVGYKVLRTQELKSISIDE